ncbi:MAG: sirohydrochlorin chelatase [Bacillota bacterium]
MKTGLIILGHGSKAPEATETLAAVTAMVRDRVSYNLVEYALLQISKPPLGAVVEKMADEGVEKIVVMPFLIAVGVHLKTDIPEELDALSKKHPGLELHLTGPLGADSRLAEIVVDRVKETELSM